MATWPARTWTPGETDTDALMNAIRDQLNELHGQVASAAAGLWTPIPFSAANFSTNAGAWTIAVGDVFLNMYTVIRKTVIWALWINTSTLAGAPVQLYLTPPRPPTRNNYNTRVSLCVNPAGTYFQDAWAYTDQANARAIVVTGPVQNPFVAGTLTLAFTLIYETP